MTAVAVGSAAIVGVGYATAPKGVVTLDLAESVDSDAAAGADDATASQDAEDGADAGTQDGSSESGGSGSGTFDGPVVTNIKGDFQAQIVVQDGVVVEVNALAAGTSAAESQRINAEAIPELSARVIEAQDWDVDAYSGASYTSPGFLESVHGAFDDAGL